MTMNEGMIEMSPVGIFANQSHIKVIGVGGGGSNAVTRMYNEGIENVEFLICNTDSQALQNSSVPDKLQLGSALTKGLGAGCNPERGRNAAIESTEDIKRAIGDNIEMVFITAGMGGGTGTGASPVIAKIAKDMGKLTIGVVTYPFRDESSETLARAYNGIEELNKYVDSILIIDNEKIYDIYSDMFIYEAFEKADNVLTTAVKGIAEIISKKGYINVDLKDVETVMKDSGMALMGMGTGKGPNKARIAIERALTSPLLNDFDIKTARNMLINISASKRGITIDEQHQIMDYATSFTGKKLSKFKRGIVYNDNMDDDTINITVVATGFKMYLTPPAQDDDLVDEDNSITMINDESDNDGSIELSGPDSMAIPETRIRDISLKDIPIYTPDKNISDFENETALDRRNRLRNEKKIQEEKLKTETDN